jgi:hypothetical protein
MRGAGLAFVTLACCVLIGGCLPTPDAEHPKTGQAAATKKKLPDIPDPNGDVAFQAFLGRLRKAIGAHDIPAVASMMTTDFGYRLDPPEEGAGVFAYWDQNNVWPELQAIVQQPFIPKENYLVSPPEFARADTRYTGYRAGIRLENGSWKFAYFVGGQ